MRSRRRFLQHSLLTAAAARAYSQQTNMPGMAAPAGPKPAARAAGPSRGLSLNPYSLAKYVDPLPVPPRAVPVGEVQDPQNPAARIPRYRIAMRPFQAKVHRDVPPTTFWGYEGRSPGPMFEARSGQPLMVEWVNDLPAAHLLPVDHTLHGAEAANPDVRAVVHLHGGKVPPESDGDPERWTVPGESRVCYYPNQQEAAALFYHDHAMGITRLNAVAGLFGMYFIRDGHEDSLNLPGGPFEIPIAIFDRMLKLDGQLDYPVSGDPDSPWTSEFYGNAVLLNGKLFPFLQVEPRRYRFRLFNTSNAQFYTLSLSREGGTLIAGREPFQMIGSDQGLLAEPVGMKSLQLTTGERADLIVDFTAYAGRELYLKHNTAPILQMRVSATKTGNDSPVPHSLRRIERTPESAAVKTRRLTLDHRLDARGRATLMLLNGAHYHMPVTEKPALDSTEIWEFVNLTDDTHPIHLHLVRFRILDRRRIDLEGYMKTGNIVYTSPAAPPEQHEMGWKDTVRAEVLMATRILVRFEGYTGRYVWHCHVLEHEDNEMMRPYEVVPA